MPQLQTFNGRRAVVLENADLEVVVLEGGGHLAAVVDKATGVSPLWVPPWPSIEPSAYGPAHHAAYGSGSDGRLLGGIMGHNVCLDIFGGPSAEEAAAGLEAHGEGSSATYAFEGEGNCLVARAEFPLAHLAFERRLELHGRSVRVRERLTSLDATDRPIAWTQHVTLGPPFLERGRTEFRTSATRSLVYEGTFGTADYLRRGATFDWPDAPLTDGGSVDLQRYTERPASSAYTTHLMDPAERDAYFVAFSPRARLAFGYIWQTSDFPWLGIWEENHSRAQPPWNGRTLTRGLEFGVSPVPETRREMVERGRLFDVPTFSWLPALTTREVEYWIVCLAVDIIPDRLQRPG